VVLRTTEIAADIDYRRLVQDLVALGKRHVLAVVGVSAVLQTLLSEEGIGPEKMGFDLSLFRPGKDDATRKANAEAMLRSLGLWR